MNTIFKALSVIALLSLTISGCNNANKSSKKDSKKTELSGAGATFPLPYYNLAFKNFKESANINVSYGGIGSGGGIRSLKDEIVDFAGTDAFLTDKELSQINPVVHIPTCIGAVVISYNLQGVTELNLTGDIVADIYLGKITQWNDPRIKAINPNVDLPQKNITPVYRSDGSGTTYVFSDYLSKVSKDWDNEMGRGKSINFNNGIAAKGNPGVVGTITQTEGAMGYVGSEYAFAQNCSIAKLENANGEFVRPSTASITSAAHDSIPADTRCSITNSTTKGAYPISCFTWIVIYKEQNYAKRSEKTAQATVDLLKFMLTDACQRETIKVHYAPLPVSVIDKAKAALSTITYNGKPIR